MDRSTQVPPGPAGKFVFGHFSDYSRDPLGFLTRCAAEYGDVASFRLPGTRFCLLSNPDDIGRVYAETNTNFINHGGLRTPLSKLLLGSGLLTSEGSEWKRQRILTFPSFQHSSVADYATNMADETRQMLDRWENNGRVEVFEEMTSLTLRTFLSTLFRTNLTEELTAISKYFVALMDGYVLENRLKSLEILLPIPVKRRFRNAIRELNNSVEHIIDERRRSGGNNENDLLDALMSAKYEDGSPITPEHLKSQIITFLFTGIFGSGVPLAWSLYLISKYQMSDRLADETNSLLGGREPSPDEIKKCTLSRGVFKEALRLYPVVWASGREAIVDCEIGGFEIPKRTQLILSQWVTHRDPRFWNEPLRFDPDRWARNESRPKYSFFPHGGGPRFCMGEAFSEMLSVIVLSMTATRFRLRAVSADPVNVIPSYALFPDRKIEVLAEKRIGCLRSSAARQTVAV